MSVNLEKELNAAKKRDFMTNKEFKTQQNSVIKNNQGLDQGMTTDFEQGFTDKR